MTTQLLNHPNPVQDPGFLHLASAQDRWGSEIGEFLTLGRDAANQLNFDDPWISGRHARIEKTEMGYRLRDLRSRNGTYLNGARILEALLCEGDRIQVGQTQLIFSKSRNLHDKGEHLRSKNPEWASTLKLLPNMAQSNLPVLILGPSGTGKEVLAHNLHQLSSRKNSPFISVNCSALSESLIESELFGHTKGSFTGATNDRKGAFESARGGTLFLDEIGDLPLSLQPKLLRALENQEIKPVGSDKNIKTDIRVLAATHHNLNEKVMAGEFRLDLYFRLNVMQIKTPALKKRMEDFEDLLIHFAKKERVSFSRETIEILKKHEWSGNVRELKNMVAKAKALYGLEITSSQQIAQLLDSPIYSLQQPEPTKVSFSEAANVIGNPVSASLIKNLEYEMIKKRLLANNGNQRQTALDLGIPKSTLHDKLKTYGIKIEKTTVSI